MLVNNKEERMNIQIEEKNTFDKALRTGISVFLGSGFSVLSKDKQGNNLPCGNGLLENLKEKFPKIAAFNDLSKVSTVLEKSMERDEFKEYLTNRFTVDEYDKLYENMTRINVPAWRPLRFPSAGASNWKSRNSTVAFVKVAW